MSSILKLVIGVGIATIYTSQTYAATDKFVCYFGSWGVYREGNGKFTVNDIDVNLCTHIIYSFIGINSDGTIKLLDEWNDINMGSLNEFINLKQLNSNLKLMVAVGGWNEKSATFSEAAASYPLRSNFVAGIIDFMTEYGFDGVDIDWEYPAQNGGQPADKDNFAMLIREMRIGFDAVSGKRFLLSAAVAATAASVDISYDVSPLSEYLDWINLMTYDFHGSYDGRTGENSPLYASSIDITVESQQKNIAASVLAWISRGARPDKLVIGMGAYGQTFELEQASNHGLGAPTIGPGNAGPYTQQAGILGYNEICVMLKDTLWTTVWDNQQKVPYSYKGNHWIGYDNTRSVRLKVDFAKAMKLGGVMVWSLDTDDFRGLCGPRNPLLNAIQQELQI